MDSTSKKTCEQQSLKQHHHELGEQWQSLIRITRASRRRGMVPHSFENHFALHSPSILLLLIFVIV